MHHFTSVTSSDRARRLVRAIVPPLTPSAARLLGAGAITLLLGACTASGGGPTTASAPAATAPDAAPGSSGPTALAALPGDSSEPISPTSATVRVAGLACPKCASNVDVQLSRIPGVRVEIIDMKHGFVQVTFERDPHPSPARLGRAVEDAGLTYLGVIPGAVPAPISGVPHIAGGG